MVIDQFELSFENNPDGLDGISFALIPYFALIIGPENSCHFLDQSDAKINQSRLGHPRFPALSRALGCFLRFCYFEFPLALKGIFLSSDWSL